ncbi:hypothetical protein MmiEs2_16160 [Methanimicrococcus stummii]|uniref:Uncharacterized protein n=1 Tax=Methanimicrococcus stummii TaxID=3028294 RepID=A0AA96ZXV1_9EURY|nr:hypothetical protein [Methanimicrococcus sp. Es2]WNY29389.1 hypothetical protein MmiEs2_16160 [Methanimicrococcus sp. Es2]
MAKIKFILMTAVLFTALVLMSGTALAAGEIEVDQAYIDSYISHGGGGRRLMPISNGWTLITF